MAIIISCQDGSEFDAGLACQNMAAEAQLLGYGTKILASPTIALNGEKQEEYRQLLSIPEGQSVVAVLLVGTEDTSVSAKTDGVTGPSERSPYEEMVTVLAGSGTDETLKDEESAEAEETAETEESAETEETAEE